MLPAVKYRCKKFRIVLMFYECNWHVSVQRCISGMTAVICTYPLDVVRARLAFQVTGEHRYTGIANAFHTIYLKVARVRCPACRWIVSVDLFCKSTFFPWLQEGGVLGFYRGLTPTLIGMAPYAGEISGFGGCNLLKNPLNLSVDVTVVSPPSRILILHLRHTEESRPQTFPGAAGSSVFRQSRRPDPKAPREPALRRRGRCRRSDDIVSAAVARPADELAARLIGVGRLSSSIHVYRVYSCFREFRYPLDVARRRMQLGAILPDSEKCVWVSASPLLLVLCSAAVTHSFVTHNNGMTCTFCPTYCLGGWLCDVITEKRPSSLSNRICLRSLERKKKKLIAFTHVWSFDLLNCSVKFWFLFFKNLVNRSQWDCFDKPDTTGLSSALYTNPRHVNDKELLCPCLCSWKQVAEEDPDLCV